MEVAVQSPWTAEQFLEWVGMQEGRFEFDGVRPVAVTGGNARHNRTMTNIHAALRARLRGTACAFYGPELAVRTVGEKVRYPDALITCTPFPDTALVVPDVVVVFEVISPTSGRTDRNEKVREYALLPSLRRYVIVETAFAGLLVLHRDAADAPWTATTLTDQDMLDLPEVSLRIPVSELYEDIAFTSVGE
jgi:Uma2 family endonuclease